MIFQSVIAKTENIYFAFSPELQVVRYGSCREEALNQLQEEASRLEFQSSERQGREER
jgi:predicted RNase H-like HicB family nuclease